MKHASWVVGGCLIAAGIVAQPAHSQQTVRQYALPAGSVGTMTSKDPTSTYSAYTRDPSLAQVRSSWDLDTPNKSGYSPYIHNPTPAQVRAVWGDPRQPNKSRYDPYLR